MRGSSNSGFSLEEGQWTWSWTTCPPFFEILQSKGAAGPLKKILFRNLNVFFHIWNSRRWDWVFGMYHQIICHGNHVSKYIFFYIGFEIHFFQKKVHMYLLKILRHSYSFHKIHLIRNIPNKKAATCIKISLVFHSTCLVTVG